MTSRDEVADALAPSLALDAPQAVMAAEALAAWVTARAAVPVSDRRLAELLVALPSFAAGLALHLDRSTGLRPEPAEGARRISLLLERGASWLRGGDWRNVVATSVSRKTSHQSHP